MNLIIGDRQTGKTAVAIDTIINQKTVKGVVCVYVAIGQKAASVAAVVDASTRRERCVWITRYYRSSYTQTIQQLYNTSRHTQGQLLAEYFMYKGQATLVIYDDLTKQAARIQTNVSTTKTTARKRSLPW